MQLTEITCDHTKVAGVKFTGLLYVLFKGNEFRLSVHDDCISSDVIVHASAIGMVDSGWLLSKSKLSIDDLPSRDYVTKLEDLNDYLRTETRYFIKPSGRYKRVGVTEREYVDLQLEHTGDTFDPFFGIMPRNFEAPTMSGFVEQMTLPKLPVVEAMPSIPAESNPFHYDHYNMGSQLSGAWMAMYNKHAGHVQGKENVWYDDPDYIIFVNQRTGQRFRLTF